MSRGSSVTGRPILDAGTPEERLLAAARATELGIYRGLGSSPSGLTEGDAAQRLAIADVPPPPRRRSGRLRAVWGPFTTLLVLLGAALAVVGDVRGVVTVAIVIVVGAVLRLRERAWSQSALRSTRPHERTTVTVRRRPDAGMRPTEREVPPDELVVGDVVVLRPGDVVAADVRVLRARGLLIDQSAFSGEALPLRKLAAGPADPDGSTAGDPPSVARMPCLCLAGTSIVGGTGTAIVLATGARTVLGEIAARSRRPRPASSVDADVRRVARTLLRFLAVLAPIVLIASGAVSGSWSEAALYAAAVATGLVPELLPVIVTIGLVRAARRLRHDGLVVTRLDAIHDLAGADIIGLDKTGTLTEGRALFAHTVDVLGRIDETPLAAAVRSATVCDRPPTPVEQALLAQAAVDDRLLTAALCELVERTDDSALRWTTALIRGPDATLTRITTGDPDVVLPACTAAHGREGSRALDVAARQRAAAIAAAENRRGLRVLAVARRVEATGFPAPDTDGYRRPPVDATGQEVTELGDAAAGSELLGFVCFLDPVRDTAAAAVAGLRERGVTPYLLTGDGAQAAEKVCDQIGLDHGRIACGADVDHAIGDGTLGELAAATTVFAELDAAHKAAVITALRDAGHVVAYLGDGANDAPALRCADVGIAVETATDVAHDAADAVLVGRDLTILAAAATTGRAALGNARKYVQLTTAANLGNVVSIVLASLFLPFLPMLPLQLMAQNIVYDLVQVTMPWDRVDPGYLARPRRWPRRGITAFMLAFGPLSSLFDLATFFVLDRIEGLNTTLEQATFQAGWFTVGLLSQCSVVLVLRTGTPWRAPAAIVAVATALGALTAVTLPYSPAAGLLHMQPPPITALGWQLGIVVAFLGATQAVKILLLRRHRDCPQDRV